MQNSDQVQNQIYVSNQYHMSQRVPFRVVSKNYQPVIPQSNVKLKKFVTPVNKSELKSNLLLSNPIHSEKFVSTKMNNINIQRVNTVGNSSRNALMYEKLEEKTNENNMNRIKKLNKSVNKKRTSGHTLNSTLKHSVRVSRIQKQHTQRVIEKKSKSPFKRTQANLIQKSVKKLILASPDLNEEQMEKVRRMSRPRSVNEKLRKIVVNQCNIVTKKEMPSQLYDQVLQEAMSRDQKNELRSSNVGLLNEQGVPKDSEEFQENLAKEIKKSIFSNHGSAKKNTAYTAAFEKEKVMKEFNPFNQNSSNMVLGDEIPCEDLYSSEANRQMRSSIRSKMSNRSRNSSCYKIVKKEVQVSAKMSAKKETRLSHDLRAFKVKAEQVENDIDISQMNSFLMKTSPVQYHTTNDHKSNYFYSPSKSDREVHVKNSPHKFVNLKSRSNSPRKLTEHVQYKTMQDSAKEIFNDNPFESPEITQIQVTPEVLAEDDLSIKNSKRWRTAVPRDTQEEEDPTYFLNQLESDIEQLKNLKKRTSSHTPTRNQRMIYRQILETVSPLEKKNKKKFKPRNKSEIRSRIPKSVNKKAKLRKNYSQKYSESSVKPKKKNIKKGDKSGLSKYCSMKYAALQLKNQQNLLENLLESCQNKFKQLDKNIVELENLKEYEFIKNKSSKPSKRFTRDSKYYSKFTRENDPHKKLVKNSYRKSKNTKKRKTTKLPKGIPSKLKINQIFRDLNKTINSRPPKTTGIPRSKYRKKKMTY